MSGKWNYTWMIVVLLCTYFLQGYAQEINSSATPPHPIDLKKAVFSFDVDPAQRLLKGKVAHYFSFNDTQTHSLTFFLHENYTIDPSSFQISGLTAPRDYQWTHTNGELIINFSDGVIDMTSTYILTIAYQGDIPTGNIDLVGIRRNINGEQFIATFSEPFGARDWWPEFSIPLSDKYESIEINLRFPEKYSGVTNGVLQKEVILDGYKEQLWTHQYPITSYLIGFAVGLYEEKPFQIQLQNNTSLHIDNYLFPKDVERALSVLLDNGNDTNNFQDYMRFMEKKFGDYPFGKEKYGHASFGHTGEIETQTISFISTWDQETIVHELAHQWFGNTVTPSHWEDIWLSEGLATYIEGLYLDDKQRFDDFKSWLNRHRNTSLRYPNRTLKVKNTTSVYDIFHVVSYSKGAMVLHMLRVMLGDEKFFLAINNYYQNNKNQYVSTQDFLDEINQVAPVNENYNAFFDHWINTADYPTIDVKVEPVDRQYKITTTQSGVIPYYYMKVPIKITYENGENMTSYIVFDAKEKVLYIDAGGKKIANIIMDENQDFLIKEIKYDIRDFTTPQINIYPNPVGNSDESLTIYYDTFLNNPSQLYLMNQQGSILKEINFTHEEKESRISLQDYPTGIYFILLQDGNTRYVKKIIKQ